jgi:hypothetical protein
VSSLGAIVTIVLRNPFQSLYPVINHALQGLFRIVATISRIAASYFHVLEKPFPADNV